ncbi:MAG TPA: ribose 5-phosphate isomerase B [Clostridiaceae bacterium]
MKIAIGSDHMGFPLKQYFIEYLGSKGYEVIDFGTASDQRVDYPIYGQKVAAAVACGSCDKGILICGTGVGISISANKVHGIRAVVCSEPYSARLARQHNNANIVAFGALVVGRALAQMIVDEFLAAEYEGGRHQKRIDMITEIENSRG